MYVCMYDCLSPRPPPPPSPLRPPATQAIGQRKLTQRLKRYCKAGLDVKLVFSTFKLRNMPVQRKRPSIARSMFACRL